VRSGVIRYVSASHAASLAEPRYSASGKRVTFVKPACSIPIELSLYAQFPACQAMSRSGTIWAARPVDDTT
jgi:hypothetical protein